MEPENQRQVSLKLVTSTSKYPLSPQFASSTRKSVTVHPSSPNSHLHVFELVSAHLHAEASGVKVIATATSLEQVFQVDSRVVATLL